MSYKTEQEEFWAGEFGTQYIQRNKSKSSGIKFKFFWQHTKKC